jgi:predicted metal-dependent HD superfamily phosphohydrolase
MKEQQPLAKIRQFVKKRYADSPVKELRFHTFGRCRKLVKAAALLAGPLHLNAEDHFILMAAAWLHDIGYTENPMDHETAGQRISRQLLSSLRVEENLIGQINELLMTTPGFHDPLDQLEEIWSDAGTYYLAKRSFFRWNELQRREQSALQAKNINKAEWALESVCWITAHQYFTATARNLLEERKQRNLTKLKSELPEAAAGNLENHESIEVVTVVNPPKKIKGLPEKGIDTMFKIASANNQRISAMADNKSRILITVNAIILSAIISLVLKRLDQDTYLAYPTFLLIGVSLVSIVFAILAIRPHDTSGVFTDEQLKNREVNMLFYGNFHQMGIFEFRAAMLGVMEDNDQVYGTLIDDLYGQGAAVGRKYRLLRVAYTVFMFGLVIAMLAFIVATVIHYHTSGPATAFLIH